MASCAARAFIKLGIKGATVLTASMASSRPNKGRVSFPDWTPLIPIVSADFFQRVPFTPSAASKAGIQHITRTLVMEWSHGIRVSSCQVAWA